MKRISIGDGRWFDADKAQKFHEETEWNGSNHISVVTGSQWDHEVLWRTEKGVWILESNSDYANVRTTYEIVDEERAAEWLVKNEYDLSAFTEEGLDKYDEALQL